MIANSAIHRCNITYAIGMHWVSLREIRYLKNHKHKRPRYHLKTFVTRFQRYHNSLVVLNWLSWRRILNFIFMTVLYYFFFAMFYRFFQLQNAHLSIKWSTIAFHTSSSVYPSFHSHVLFSVSVYCVLYQRWTFAGES